jgi:hypothetical protein
MPMGSKGYSDFSALSLLTFQAVSIAGTAAADTAIADTQRVLPLNGKFVAGRVYLKTGGTAAGPKLLFQYSRAGTGTYTTFGSWTSGTAADNTGGSAGFTDTQLLAGDFVRCAVLAGTAAATPVVHAALVFQETFTGD